MRQPDIEGSAKFFRGQPKEVSKPELFSFILQNRGKYGLCLMCEVLEVTRQGYNKWLKSQGKPYKHEALLVLIRQVLGEDDENGETTAFGGYFWRCAITRGYMGSYSAVCRVCRENDTILPKKRSPNSLTEDDKEAQKSENMIKQDFTAEMPNTGTD